jgi:hypothetical protein
LRARDRSCHSRATSRVDPGTQRTTTVTSTPPTSWSSSPDQQERIPRMCLIRMRSWGIDRARSPARCGLWVGGWDPSTVEVAAPPPAVGPGPELSLQLHQAPDPAAIGTDVRLDFGGRLAQAGQVDAEQLRAPLQRRRDRPSQARVVPGPHRPRLSNTSSKPYPESCVPREGSRSACMGRAEAEPGMGCRHSPSGLFARAPTFSQPQVLSPLLPTLRSGRVRCR